MKFHIQFVFAVLALFLSTGSTHADLGDQLFKLLDHNGMQYDQFGASVSVSGSTAIVGARFDDDQGPGPGSAFLFDVVTGMQIAHLHPRDGQANMQFGYSVAIHGTTAIIGANADNPNGEVSGSAYLFDVTTGQQIFKLLPDDGAIADQFGRSVSIHGNTAIVGAIWDDDNGSKSGSAYLFDISTGRQINKLLPNDGEEEDWFGYSVAISSTTAIVSAVFEGEFNIHAGAAYLFDIETGEQLAKLVANDRGAWDQFGFSVSINSTKAIIGAMRNDDYFQDTGSAYLFDVATGTQIKKLLASDGAMFDEFGYSVAINDVCGRQIAVVGAEHSNDNGNNSGAAYLFDTNTGQEIIKLFPKDGEEGDVFGWYVDISGDTVIVGAIGDDDNNDSSGSAYIFDATYTNECPWDLDNSCIVGTSDLLALFAQWGTAGQADFDGDGFVGKSDLVVLLANWGPCP